MKTIKTKNSKLFLFLVFTLFAVICNAQIDSLYLGQTPPGNTPVLFAPAIISLDNRNECSITFSPDGKKCYFTEHDPTWNDWCRIKETIYQGSAWSTPEDASFTNDYSMCPSISSDGTQLFFASYRNDGMDVYQCLSTAGGDWSAPVKMNNEINSTSSEYSCHTSNLGNMFVCSWRSGGVGGCDGWRIPFVNSQYQQAENLGALNTIDGDCYWTPGPNEDYLIFQRHDPLSTGGGGFFDTDLFITFAMPGGGWSAPQNLGPAINSSATDGFAWISHDGKYLFFSSNRLGTMDLYWVSLDSILENTPVVPLPTAIHNPVDYVLYQNYPNPFDQTTTIQFNLNKPGNTKLTIYNLAGQKIETILDEYQQAGKYQIIWNGKGYHKGEYLCELLVSDAKSGQVFLHSTIQILLR